MVNEMVTVRATWDADTQCWLAESDDIPGLVAEADTMEELVREIKLVAPDLLELNHCPERLGLPIMITAQREERMTIAG